VENPGSEKFANEVLGLMTSFGGGNRGGSGTGVGYGGKVIKIPPRQDLQALPADQRDQLIAQAVQMLAQDISDEQLREQVTQAAAGAAR
jgi:hypothetical protein